MAGLVDDLVIIIATYATEPITYNLLTLSQNLTGQVYANKQYFWRMKSLYETRGLTVDPQVIDGNWMNYYRLNNRSYYGTCKALQVPVATLNTVVVPIPVVACISYQDEYFAKKILVQDNSGYLAVYEPPLPRDRRNVATPHSVVATSVTQLERIVPRIRAIYTSDRAGFPGYVHWIDERGDCYSFDVNTNNINVVKLGHNLVALASTNNYVHLIYVSRYGTAVSTHPVISNGLIVSESSSMDKVLSMDGRPERLSYNYIADKIVGALGEPAMRSIGYAGATPVDNKLISVRPELSNLGKLLYCGIIGTAYPYITGNRRVHVLDSEQPALGLVQHVEYDTYFMFIVD